ncbi:S-adenosylmethionine:tRNA ribosyltransferase-isomerase [Pseudonocardia bannensis]|uniref:S-adenosylmethionine:tRNA ribosyltransferase-isomerase n=1 Tax=Pseudonocardia bannensis TaxID=630973 RepID=A0A848DL39_9PSEU|nr:S-adenosylmethionine:tRNA ribosyltransferase-isomerase [Pseudonocardia bannensis]NMH93408.1 S-adenosylmethionine:tRNA ribosyltransferase-isomerase [Pseudonocardia bannensis]
MTTSARATATTRFALPAELSATEPIEARGLARDEVRLLVARTGRPIRHRRFRDLPAALARGDLVVVNTSPTAPAAVDGLRSPDAPWTPAGHGRPAVRSTTARGGRSVVVHVSGPVPAGAAGELVVELRSPAGGRLLDGVAGERITLPGGVTATLLAGHPDPAVRTGSRLWRALMAVPGGPARWLDQVGRPISYSYLRGRRPIEAYQTVFAEPARHGELPSAEMPSAGRPFTRAVLHGLAARGVGVAEVVLHTGVSSLEADETPLPERYRVPAATVETVNATRARAGRIIAVGTTVARALETVAGPDGVVRAGAGWTDVVLGPGRPVRVVDGIITGWHEPAASHLLLLEAVAGPDLVGRAYAAALRERYLWHEFGDSCLLLRR